MWYRYVYSSNTPAHSVTHARTHLFLKEFLPLMYNLFVLKLHEDFCLPCVAEAQHQRTAGFPIRCIFQLTPWVNLKDIRLLKTKERNQYLYSAVFYVHIVQYNFATELRSSLKLSYSLYTFFCYYLTSFLSTSRKPLKITLQGQHQT